MQPINHARVLLAFVVSTLVALFALPFPDCLSPSSKIGCVSSAAGIALLGIWFAIPVAAAIAFPLFLLLRRLGWTTWWHLTLSGGIASLVGALAWGFVTSASLGSNTAIHFSAIGMVAGFTFWLVGLRTSKS